MIAAGSLFTSCVENTEPQGIRDLREAKADYLASLSKLREADAEKVKAEAAVEQAKAEVQKAIAAQNQALAEAQQIANEAASIQNEEAAARAKAAIDTIKARAELDAVKAQEALAKAQADLDKALRKIAAEAIGLTGDEKYAITEKTFALNMAYGTYNAWLDAYNGAVEELWKAEYAVAAGKESYETADSYRDSIADVQAQIAELEADIASYEALKEEPAGVKDTLDAIADEILALEAEIRTKGDVRTLYEASVPFVDAKKAFKERVEKFIEDSIKVAEFKFVDVDEDGKEIPVAYELTDGKGVDKKFGNIINNKWEVSKHLSNSSEEHIYYYLVEDGFYYDKKAVQVGKVNDNKLATPEQLTEGLDVLDQIVETLNRELVVVDNIKDSTTIEDAKKAAHVADSVFDAHYAILKAGLAEYAPYKDSVAKIDTLKAAKEDARVKDSIAGVKVAADEVAIKDALKAAAKDYIEANQAFVDAVNDIVDGEGIGSISKTDSTAFIKAVQNLGKAQAAYLGKTDSLVIVVEKDGKLVENNKVSIAELVASGFVEKPHATIANKVTSLYGGTGYGMFAGKTLYSCEENAWYSNSGDEYKGKTNAFSRVALAILKGTYETFAFSSPIKDDQVAYSSQAGETYDPKSPIAYKPVTDTVKWGSIVAKGVEAPYTTLAEDKKAKETTEKAYTKATEALKNYKGVENATVAYQKIYKSFWGITGNLDPTTKEECVKPQQFTWTKKTFLEPENCVEFTYFVLEEGIIGAEVINNSTLKTILDNVDPEGYHPEKSTPNMHRIFRNKDTQELTEFAQAILKAQIVEDLGEYVPNKARLEKINAQVAKIREDVEAAIAEYEAGFEGLEEVLARFYGVDEDGEILFVINPALNEWHVADGKWNYGGYLLAWAEELAPEYPAIVKDAEEAVRPLNHRKANLANFKKTLDQVYTAWWNEFEKEGKFNQRSVAAIVKFFESKIDDLNDQIDVLNGDIARYEEIIDACEAGYSPAEAKVAPLKKKVEAYKKYLAQAEEALARAQKEYDEVIAKYGVNE